LDKTYPEDEVFDTMMEVEGDNDDPDTESMEDIDPPPGPSTPRIPDILPAHIVDMEKCIVFTSKILELLHKIHGVVCNRSTCGKKWVYTETYVGSCLVVTWKCSSGHLGGSWSSQPMFNKLRAGNLLLSTCLLLSGNSFIKIAMFFKFLNLKFISNTLFHQHQGLYIGPAVQEYWSTMQQNLLDERNNKDVLLSSDARNDSPGFCAQYCTYSLCDAEEKVILQQNVIDVREVEGRKSPNMERLGFERGMDVLLETDMCIKEVITDGHTGIAALMSK
jgi:hypothetical protein